MGKTLKANDKLPMGSYFVIKVGHRFYGGESLERKEVEVPGKLINDHEYNSYHWYRHRTSRRAHRDHRKETTAKYLKPIRRSPSTIRNDLTGNKISQLVDTEDQAKKFRKKESAQNACDTLKRVYGSLDIEVSIIEGETK